MKHSDWINLAIAIGVAITAAFTAFSFFVVRRQARITRPGLHSHFSLAPYQEYLLFSIGIDPPEKQQYVIDWIKIRRPRKTRICIPQYVQDGTGAMVPNEPGIWSRSLSFNRQDQSSVSMFVDAPRGTELSLRVKVSLKSDPRVTSRLIHHAKIAD